MKKLYTQKYFQVHHSKSAHTSKIPKEPVYPDDKFRIFEKKYIEILSDARAQTTTVTPQTMAEFEQDLKKVPAAAYPKHKDAGVEVNDGEYSVGYLREKLTDLCTDCATTK